MRSPKLALGEWIATVFIPVFKELADFRLVEFFLGERAARAFHLKLVKQFRQAEAHFTQSRERRRSSCRIRHHIRGRRGGGVHGSTYNLIFLRQ